MPDLGFIDWLLIVRTILSMRLIIRITMLADSVVEAVVVRHVALFGVHIASVELSTQLMLSLLCLPIVPSAACTS